jgi:DNA-binding winged helix-turn-helix (wHTH) protein
MTPLIQSRVKFGPFEADLTTRELWRNGVRLKCGGQPFEILIALADHPGQLVSRDELRKRIWSADTFVDFNHGLNAAVNKLREALCDSPEDPRYIETLPRRGYRFIAKVEHVQVEVEGEIQAPRAEPAEAVSAGPPAPPAAWQPPRTPQPWNRPFVEEGWQSSVAVRRQTLVHLLALVAPLLLLIVGVSGFFWSRWSSSHPTAEEIENFQKQGAEAARKETEFQRKQQEERNGSVASMAENPARSDAKRLLIAKPPAPGTAVAAEHPPVDLRPSPSEESFLLRMTRPAGTVLLLPEAPDDDKPSILRVDLGHQDGSRSVARILRGWDAVGGPQPSPDGKKLAFMAGHTNSTEIWVCNIDGSSPKRLTSLSSAGTPRWSPDSRWIAFDSDGRYGHSGIYIVAADGGTVQAVVQNEANNSVPSWSRDGRYIYFASNRGSVWEGDQVWKVPFSGGEAVQITRHGGFSAYESTDGQTLYYAKTRYQNPEIWQVPATGGDETRVALVHPTTWASWAITKDGILLLSDYHSSASQLEYFDFDTRSVHALATLAKASFWLAASADGSSVWYSELTDTQARQVFTASMN